MTNYFHNCVQYDQHQQEHYQLKEIKIFLIKKGILVIVPIRFISFCLFYFSGRKGYSKMMQVQKQ